MSITTTFRHGMKRLDELLIVGMHRGSIPALRVTLGVVFLWFGALKTFGVSPVAELVRATYWFFPPNEFFFFLGVWEAVVGIGLIFKLSLRVTLALLWLQMLGTFGAVVLAPGIFFEPSNFVILTLEGEFVVKNLVLVAASLVVGGFEVSYKLHRDGGESAAEPPPSATR